MTTETSEVNVAQEVVVDYEPGTAVLTPNGPHVRIRGMPGAQLRAVPSGVDLKNRRVFRWCGPYSPAPIR